MYTKTRCKKKSDRMCTKKIEEKTEKQSKAKWAKTDK